MSSPILVPLDGSDFAERALPLAQALARATGAPLILLHVRSGYDKSGRDTFDPTTIAERLRASGLTVDSLVYDLYVDGPGKVIANAAADQGAALIVMATHGRGGIGRWLYGSTTEEALYSTTVPILLTPADCESSWPSDRRPRILLTLDGSEWSEQIIPPLTEFARSVEAEVTILFVIDEIDVVEEPTLRPGTRTRRSGDKVETTGGHARRYVEGVADRLRAAGISATTRTPLGDATEEIVRAARELDVDIVAMATHGRTGLVLMALGSVANGVLRRGHVPVLFVRVNQVE